MRVNQNDIHSSLDDARPIPTANDLNENTQSQIDSVEARAADDVRFEIDIRRKTCAWISFSGNGTGRRSIFFSGFARRRRPPIPSREQKHTRVLILTVSHAQQLKRRGHPPTGRGQRRSIRRTRASVNRGSASVDGRGERRTYARIYIIVHAF